jgi:hypothetical protein
MGEGAASSSSSTPKPLGTGSGMIEIGPVMLNATDEDKAYINAFGKTIMANFIFKIASLILTVAFFMPFFSIQIRMFGVSAGQSMNGWTTLVGLEGASGSFMAIFLLLIPIAIFVLFQFKGQLMQKFPFIKGKLFTFSTGGFVLGFIVLFIVRSSVSGTFRGMAGGAFGFWLSLFVYLIAGIVSIGCFLSARKLDIRLGKAGGQSARVSPSIATGGSSSSATHTAAPSIQKSTPKPSTPDKPLAMPINLIFVGFSVVLLIIFFALTWVEFDMGGGIFGGIPGLGAIPGMEALTQALTLTYNGWEAAFGHEGDDGLIVAVFFLLIPIALAALFMAGNFLKMGALKVLSVSTGVCVLGIILLIVFAIQQEDLFGFESLSIGYFVSVVIYVLTAIASVVFLVISKKKNATAT